MQLRHAVAAHRPRNRASHRRPAELASNLSCSATEPAGLSRLRESAHARQGGPKAQRAVTRAPAAREIVCEGLLGLTNWSIPLKSGTYSDSSIPPLPPFRQLRTSAVQPLREFCGTHANSPRHHQPRSPAALTPRHTRRLRFRNGADSAHETNAREPIQGSAGGRRVAVGWE